MLEHGIKLSLLANEYHIIVRAQDANGWKDVDIIEVKLGGNSQALANYGTTMVFTKKSKRLD